MSIEDGRERGRPAALGVVIGIGSGIVGLLPWLALGERLPLQNLWRTQTLPADMPWALLPLSQYYLGWLVGLLVVPGLVAGVVVRALPGRELRVWVGPATLLIQVAAVVQSLAVLIPGLRASTLMTIYIVGLAVVCTAAVGVGHLVFWQVTSPDPSRVAMGVVLAAVPLGYWLRGLWGLVLGQFRVPTWLTLATGWIPAVLAGLVLAWSGWRRQVRGVVWLVGVLMVWLAPAAIDATGAAVARNTAAQGPRAAFDAWLHLFGTLAGPGGTSLWGAGAAALLGLAGLVAGRVRRGTARAARTEVAGER